MWKPDICLYHSDCLDGFGAAWAIWKRWGNDVVYLPGTYGKPLPIGCEDRNVLFVDFSAKRAEIEEMAKVAKSTVIVDHHKTAEEDLQPFSIGSCDDGRFSPRTLDDIFDDVAVLKRPPVVAWFDMEQSGAVMAWKFAHPDAEVPKFLRYIEDRDLWRFKFGDRTRQFAAALRTYAMDFGLWDQLILNLDRLIDEGQGIVRAHRCNVEKFLAEVYIDPIDGHSVPVVNVPYHYASDVGNALLKQFPRAPFAATWCRRGDGMVQYSLRSEDSRLDVSLIATKFGGGGHRNAAGFQRDIGSLVI